MRFLLLGLVLSLASVRGFADDGIVPKSTIVAVNVMDYQRFSVLFDAKQAVVGLWDVTNSKANFAICDQVEAVYSDCTTASDRWFDYTPENLADLKFNFGLNLEMANVLIQARSESGNVTDHTTVTQAMIAGNQLRKGAARSILAATGMDVDLKARYQKVFEPDGLITQTIDARGTALPLSAVESTILYTIGQWMPEMVQAAQP